MNATDMKISQETFDLAKAALAKATTTGLLVATALQAYDLEAPSKKLYPVLTPLRNSIARLGGIGTATHYKAITAINVGNLSAAVAEAARNSYIQYTEVDVTLAYKSFGLDGKVSDEAVAMAQGFEDARALSSMAVLQSVMMEEEKLILGGAGSVNALGTCGTVTTSASSTGGLLPTLTYDVICVALGYFGWRNSSATALTIPTGTGSGHSIKSATATQAVTLGQHLFASVAAINGAFAYAWFIGASGAAKLEAITTINSLDFSTALVGTGLAVSTAGLASDESLNSLAFDGILPQLLASGSGAYVKVMATGTAGTGSTLTGDGAGGIVEIDTMLKTMFDTAKIGPAKIYCSTQELQNITKKVIAGGAAPIMRLNVESGGAQNTIQGGARVGSYLNKNTQTVIPIEVHPYMAPGTILAVCDALPYPNANVPNVMVMRMVREYQDLDFARVLRQFEHGVYAMGALEIYFPAGFGIITNIANG